MSNLTSSFTGSISAQALAESLQVVQTEGAAFVSSLTRGSSRHRSLSPGGRNPFLEHMVTPLPRRFDPSPRSQRDEGLSPVPFERNSPNPSPASLDELYANRRCVSTQNRCLDQRHGLAHSSRLAREVLTANSINILEGETDTNAMAGNYDRRERAWSAPMSVSGVARGTQTSPEPQIVRNLRIRRRQGRQKQEVCVDRFQCSGSPSPSHSDQTQDKSLVVLPEDRVYAPREGHNEVARSPSPLVALELCCRVEHSKRVLKAAHHELQARLSPTSILTSTVATIKRLARASIYGADGATEPIVEVDDSTLGASTVSDVSQTVVHFAPLPTEPIISLDTPTVLQAKEPPEIDLVPEPTIDSYNFITHETILSVFDKHSKLIKPAFQCLARRFHPTLLVAEIEEIEDEVDSIPHLDGKVEALYSFLYKHS
ncbi:hypothetical protein GMRT_11003 [Giardia muris]|uniref:Uncharacterized protein n=1 Tax=Giardia muris TaxID=5742 RepID=A0A4Z1SUB6_GIAMU|nr:hypothetical protein GMRT_11003 [Giardia muris]|eukprot:TNJ29310.1 hypothetical protein GMRT_11003 [Giardia muris]